MKRVWQALGLLLFLVVAAYGLSRFLAAHEVRAQLADAEAFCAERGGVGPIETDGGAIVSIACEDGTRLPTRE